MKLQIRDLGYSYYRKRWCFELIVTKKHVFRFAFNIDGADTDVLESAMKELVRRVRAGGPSALSGGTKRRVKP